MPYSVIQFSQYQSERPDDDLLMFAAPAKDIWAWAGIPRKGWKVRMLFQRWITPRRTQEVTAFWRQAAEFRPEEPKGYTLGPTALTIAIFETPEIVDGQISLAHSTPFELTDPRSTKLGKAAQGAIERMRPRLTTDELEVLGDVEANPTADLPDFDHNYVLESLCQIAQAAGDPNYFVQENDLSGEDQDELIQSLEALCRPALVVDGQHRLYGAAHVETDVWLPVVALPNSPWMEGIFQFVVINEKAERVGGELLTDIFGSSLTPSEQASIRVQLDRSGAQVEERIAATVAARDPNSPFNGLVRFSFEGVTEGFIPERTIRQLIEGGGRGSRGWRQDDEFYESYVKPTFPTRLDWDSWTTGKWVKYWFAFWETVGEFYNEQAQNALWTPNGQSNLTKAVTLRLFQALFMKVAVEHVTNVRNTRGPLLDILGDEEQVDMKIEEEVHEVAIPSTIDEFKQRVREDFLKDGVPVRVFERLWVASLDDQAGQQNLRDELEKAYVTVTRGDIYRAQNRDVFAVED